MKGWMRLRRQTQKGFVKAEGVETRKAKTKKDIRSRVSSSFETNKTTVGSVGTCVDDQELENLFADKPQFLLANERRPGNLVVFRNHNIRTCTPSQVVSLVEEYEVSPVGICRALQFKPSDGDVLLCTAPRCGEGIILCMLDLLSRGARGVTGGDRMEGSSVTVPWLESKEYDENPRVLDELQAGFLRIYKSHMTCKSISDKFKSKAKFITVVRDPKDYRFAYYKHLERSYEFERNGNERLPAFVAKFDLDDFAMTEVPFVRGFEGSVSYERNIIDWIEASESFQNVHVIFYEDIIDNTPLVLESLAKFLEIDTNPTVTTRILNHVNFTKLRSHYSPFHVFSGDDALIQVGSGVDRFTTKANISLNHKWNLEVRSMFPAYKDYATLYSLVRGQPYPFEYNLLGSGYSDHLCAEFYDSLTSCCFPKLSGGHDAPSKSRFGKNRFSSWL